LSISRERNTTPTQGYPCSCFSHFYVLITKVTLVDTPVGATLQAGNIFFNVTQSPAVTGTLIDVLLISTFVALATAEVDMSWSVALFFLIVTVYVSADAFVLFLIFKNAAVIVPVYGTYTLELQLELVAIPSQPRNVVLEATQLLQVPCHCKRYLLFAIASGCGSIPT